MQHPAYRFDDFELLPAARELRRAGVRIGLPPRAFRCLVMLVDQRDRVLGRDELIAALWPRGSASDVQLGQLILQCRRAVDDDGQTQRAIRTVPGFGYRWVLPTEAFDAVDTSASDDDTPDTTIDAPPPATAIEPPPTHTPDTTPPEPSRDRIEATHAPAATTHAQAKPTRRHLARTTAIAALVLLAITITVALVRPGTDAPPPATPTATPADTATTTPTDDRLLVLPLPTTEHDEPWIRLGGMDLIGDRLRRSGLAVLPSDTTVSLLHGLDAATPAPDIAATLRRSAGISHLIDTTLQRDGDTWQAQVTATRADGSRAVGQTRAASPVAALRNAADRLAAALGHVPAAPDDSTGVAETMQRARAAMLANEPDAARAILLADPVLVRDQPRLRQQLAEVDIRAGRPQAARAALESLLADTPTPSPFRAELLAGLGTVDVRHGDFVAAGQRASEALAMVGTDDPILGGRLHMMRGISRISLQDYAGALVDSGIARDAFQRAGDIGSVARVDANLGVLEILRGHPAQAEPYLERAIARFGELGIRQEPIGNLQMLYVARRMQLRYDGAMQAIDTAWDQRARILNPDSQLSVRLYRIQGLLRTGRLAEAATLLDDPANDRTPADPADAERLVLLRADLAWRRGQPAEALAHLADAPEAELASADSDTPRADTAVLRSRLERQLGRSAIDDTRLHLPPTDDSHENPRLPWRWLAAANRAATAGQTALADSHYQRALMLADRLGVAEIIAGIAGDYVAFLVETDRIEDASAIAHRLAFWSDVDLDAALARLRVAHAQGQLDAWKNAAATARRVAGEQPLPPDLLLPPTP